MLIFLHVVVLLLIITPTFSLSSIIGHWESVDGTTCMVKVHIGVNTFKQYADGDCDMESDMVGSYYVSDDMIVFRVSFPEKRIPSVLYYYNVSGEWMSFFDMDHVLVVVLKKSDEVHLLNGVWDGEMVSTISLVPTSHTGRGYFHQGDLYYYYESKRDFGRIKEWSFNEASNSGTLKNKYLGSSSFYSPLEQTVIRAGSSFVISGNALNLITSKVKLNSKRSNDNLNGHYYYLDSTPCNHYLELVNGFYVEIVGGNTNCDNFDVLYGIYDIVDDSHVTIKIGSSAVKTIHYNKTNGLVLDNIEYIDAVQQVRNLTRSTYEYESNLITTLINLLSGVLTSLTGLSISPNNYDIIDTGSSLFKRSTSEAQIVIHSPYSSNDGGEVISSSSGDVVVVPDSSSTSNSDSSNSGSFSTSNSDSSSNSGSVPTSSNSGISISTQSSTVSDSRTSDTTITGDNIHLGDGQIFQGKYDMLIIVLAVATVLIVVIASAIVYVKYFLQDTR